MQWTSRNHRHSQSGVRLGADTGLQYNIPLECSWLIIVPRPQVIRIVFTSFSTSIYADYVDVYEGSEQDYSKRLYRESGDHALDQVLTPSNTALVTFTSYGVGGTTSNFVAVAYAAPPPPSPTQRLSCKGRRLITATSGGVRFVSGTGATYDNNLDCSWLITVPATQTIRIVFTSFFTESGGDIVTVYDGATVLDRQLYQNSGYLMSGRGSGSVDIVRTTGNTALVTFFTNDYYTLPGFVAFVYADGASRLASESSTTSSTTSAVPIAIVVGSVVFVVCALVLSAMVLIRKRQAAVRSNQVVHVRPRGTPVL